MNRVSRTSALMVVALIGLGLVAGRLLPPLIGRMDGSVPRMGWAPALTLLLAAAVVASFAWSTWQSLHKKHERMTASHGIKMLALGKSAALVGALVAGFYGGFALAFVDALDSPLGKERALRGGGAALTSLLLMVAGLLLERACQLPSDSDDDEGNPKRGTSRPDRGPDPTPA